MASKKNLRKLSPRGRKARFAEFAGRTKTAVGQWAKGRFHSDHLDQAIRAWDPDANGGPQPAGPAQSVSNRAEGGITIPR